MLDFELIVGLQSDFTATVLLEETFVDIFIFQVVAGGENEAGLFLPVYETSHFQLPACRLC